MSKQREEINYVGVVMIVIYDIKLVLLLVLIAVLASYFALEIVGQIVVAQESVRKYSEETQPP